MGPVYQYMVDTPSVKLVEIEWLTICSGRELVSYAMHIPMYAQLSVISYSIGFVIIIT